MEVRHSHLRGAGGGGPRAADRAAAQAGAAWQGVRCAEGRDGENLLRSILTSRPDVLQSAAVNTFLQRQTREDRAALLALLEEPTPQNPLGAATEILGILAEQGILRELGSLGAQLKSPDVTEVESEEIMRKITELQRINKKIIFRI